MNLPLFLKNVDELSEKMSREELAAFIHKRARTLPEEGRDAFIQELKDVGKVTEAALLYKELELSDNRVIIDEIKNIREMLIRIDEGELYLESEINVEYDDWYNSDVDEFLFQDPDNILGTIDKAINLSHQCVDMGLYEEGYELAELLSVMEIQDEGECQSYTGEPLYLEDLERYHLLAGDFRELCRDAIYLAYMGNVLEERADAIYRMMSNLKCYSTRLETVMQNGTEEFGQFDEFLELWIEYLSNLPGRNVEKLIMEAQLLTNDAGKELENAKKYAKQYPVLYEQYLRKKLSAGEDKACFEIGWEALSEVPENFDVRSHIALLTAQYAIRIQKIEEAERCWIEAFRSETSLVNYIRVFMESRDFSRYEKEMTDICMSAGESRNFYALLFFKGEFRKVLKEGMNVKQALGWSNTFMKVGIALFLLHLHSGEDIPSGLKAMCDRAVYELAFSKEEYVQGLGESIALDDHDLFMECFCKWKSRITMPEKECQEIMDKLENLIEIRVEGIMQANRRNYYGECAAFVAAYGEVAESRGEQDGKQKFMDMFRRRYPRRSAFRQELKMFGYID